MTNSLNEILIQNDYRTIKLNIPGIMLNVKSTCNNTLAIVTVDESGDTFYTKEQFENISRQIRNFIINTNSTRYRFLYLIISDDDTSIKRLLNDNVSYWRIIPSQKCLMVFETACDDFLSLRKPIENMLLENITATEYNTSNNTENEYLDYNNNSSFFDKEINPKPAVVNTGIIIVNVVIFILMSLLIFPGSDKTSDNFALDWERVINYGEFYRLFTSMFIHSGIDHIFNNMLVLLFTGSYLELALGRINYFIVYISSGILAGLTSMVYNMSNNNYIQSVGASGAIFGVMGGMVAIIFIKHFHTHNLDLRKILFMAFLSLYGGFTSQGVDNAAHIGGFISGFIISFIIYMIHIRTHGAAIRHK